MFGPCCKFREAKIEFSRSEMVAPVYVTEFELSMKAAIIVISK